MRITLMLAPLRLSKFASAAPVVPPIGLAYIASSLIKAQHEVHVIDGIGEAIDLVSWTRHPTRPFKRMHNFGLGIEESRMDEALGYMRRRRKFLRSGKEGLMPPSVLPF